MARAIAALIRFTLPLLRRIRLDQLPQHGRGEAAARQAKAHLDGSRVACPAQIVHGQPQGPLVYRYDLNVAQRLDITGDVAPESGWQHQVQFRLTDIKEWVRDWDANFPVVPRIPCDLLSE